MENAVWSLCSCLYKIFLLSATTQTLIVSRTSDLDIINTLKLAKRKLYLKVAQHPSICRARQPGAVPSDPSGSLLEREIMERRQRVRAHERSAQRNVICSCWNQRACLKALSRLTGASRKTAEHQSSAEARRRCPGGELPRLRHKRSRRLGSI